MKFTSVSDRHMGQMQSIKDLENSTGKSNFTNLLNLCLETYNFINNYGSSVYNKKLLVGRSKIRSSAKYDASAD